MCMDYSISLHRPCNYPSLHTLFFQISRFHNLLDRFILTLLAFMWLFLKDSLVLLLRMKRVNDKEKTYSPLLDSESATSESDEESSSSVLKEEKRIYRWFSSLSSIRYLLVVLQLLLLMITVLYGRISFQREPTTLQCVEKTSLYCTFSLIRPEYIVPRIVLIVRCSW